jgi:hypothetical protein
VWTATQANASTTIDIRGSWSLVATTEGANYPQTVIFTTEDFSSGAVTGTDGPETVTGTINGSTLKTHDVQPGYTWDAVGTVTKSGNTLAWNGTFTDSAGHPNGTFTSTLTTPATGQSPAAGGKILDVRGLWDGYYIAPGGAKYHNPVDFLTEDFASGALTGTDNGTDGAATITGSISGRTITATISQPATNYSAKVTWVLSADGSKLIAGDIADPNATNAFVLFRHGAPVGGNALTSGAGVTSGPAPINALPTPAEAFSSPGRIVASAAISIAALLFITFPANLFNKTFEENYDVIAAWWEPRLRRFRRKPGSSAADAAKSSAAVDAEGLAATAGAAPAAAAETGATPAAAAGVATEVATESNRDRWTFGVVVVAGAILGGLLNPKFGANSASVNSFIATLLSVLVGTVVGTAVGFAYRRRKKYDVTRHFEALPAGLAIAALCVILSRVSDFQPGYLYGVVCGVAFAGTLKKNESGHLVALGHLATIAVAVIAWFVWVPVNHAALHHTGVFPLVILDDLLASLFVGGLVGSVINLIPVRFMPGHTLASWHRGAWMAVFGIAAFGMTEIVVFPSRHNHAGHAPLVTIIVLFVLFGGGSLAFREYFSRRDKRLELAKAAAGAPAAPQGSPAAISIPEAGAAPADAAAPADPAVPATADGVPADDVPADDGPIPVPRAEELDPTAPLEPVVENASALGIETPRAETSGL